MRYAGTVVGTGGRQLFIPAAPINNCSRHVPRWTLLAENCTVGIRCVRVVSAPCTPTLNDLRWQVPLKKKEPKQGGFSIHEATEERSDEGAEATSPSLLAWGT